MSGALSLRKIAKELAAADLLNENGQVFNPNAIKRMPGRESRNLSFRRCPSEERCRTSSSNDIM